MEQIPLKGRTAIVTGVGGEGIGLAVARQLAQAGANVAVTWNRNNDAVGHAENIWSIYGVQCKFAWSCSKSLVLMVSRRPSIPAGYK